MIKRIIQLILLLLILAIFGIFYLSYFGIKTTKFNELIKNEVSKINEKINIELQDVKIILNLSDYTIGLKTINSNLIIGNKKIELENITTNFSIGSFINKEFAVKKLSISTKKNKIKNIIDLARIYKNSAELFIIDKIVKNGNIIADINLNFDEKGKITKEYDIKGKIFDANLSLLNKQEINKINFNFEIKDKTYLLKETSVEYDRIKLSSKKININSKKKHFLVKGDIKSSETNLKNEILSFYLKDNVNISNFSDIRFGSSNSFSFTINKKFKFSNIKVDSKINLIKLIYKTNDLEIKKYLPKYNGIVELNNNDVKVSFDNKKLTIHSKGKFTTDKITDELDLKITLKDENYHIKSKIKLNNNPIAVKFLNYIKEENKSSLLNIELLIKKNKNILVKNFVFKESENIFLVNDLNLDNNFKINHVNNLEFDFLNNNKIKNKISFIKNKKNYLLSGTVLDGSIIIDKMLKPGKEKNIISKIFSNFNSNISLDINKTYIDKDSYLNELHGNLVFVNNNLVDLNLMSNLLDDKKFNLTIKTDENGEEVTTLFSGYAKPFVKKYKFVKGFDEGSLDFYSSKKDGISKSQLKIYDFKLKELPILTKILTLASLQGAADLLSGEGIRFTELEMNFSNKGNVMTVEELYAIGPAISILMDGYIEIDKLVSLRGTLVPATTINKIVSSIPLLGDILVGKKIGEGVFGVSFKIKGHPKKLNTTVNPIKTLTPRFITRTLEKIKKNN